MTKEELLQEYNRVSNDPRQAQKFVENIIDIAQESSKEVCVNKFDIDNPSTNLVEVLPVSEGLDDIIAKGGLPLTNENSVEITQEQAAALIKNLKKAIKDQVISWDSSYIWINVFQYVEQSKIWMACFGCYLTQGYTGKYFDIQIDEKELTVISMGAEL